MTTRSQHKLLLPRDLRDSLSGAADRDDVSMSDIVRQELTALARTDATPPKSDPVVFHVTTDDVVWREAEAQARAQGLSLSAAMRLRLANRVQL